MSRSTAILLALAILSWVGGRGYLSRSARLAEATENTFRAAGQQITLASADDALPDDDTASEPASEPTDPPAKQPTAPAEAPAEEPVDGPSIEVDAEVMQAIIKAMPAKPKAMPESDDEDAELDKLTATDEDLTLRTDEAADLYKSATSEKEKDKIRNTLIELIEKHFDVRQQLRAHEIQRMEAELNRQREALERRSTARNKIVERRLQDLLGDEVDDLSF